MEIYVNYEYRKDDLASLLDVDRLSQFVLTQENLPDTTELSITFVDNDEIRSLNKQWRDIDSTTDVLSFECDGIDGMPNPSEACVHTEEQPAFPENMPFELGDIVIAPDVAEVQAQSFGFSFADELSLLITHGLLHLCGYDHEKADEALHMEEREQELLSLFWGRAFERISAF